MRIRVRVRVRVRARVMGERLEQRRGRAEAAPQRLLQLRRRQPHATHLVGVRVRARLGIGSLG